ncbi:MAG: methyltransferase domain-containing protein [Halieaceae bacterium]
MNLFDMLRRRDRRLQLGGAPKISKNKIFGQLWRGIVLEPGESVTLENLLQFYPFTSRPDFCGWYGVAARRKGEVRLSLVHRACEEGVFKRRLDSHPVPLLVPWKFDGSEQDENLDLKIENTGSGKDSIFIAVHRALSRNGLLKLAKGKGLEIGPGPHPQVKPSFSSDVYYIEQMPPEDWNRLYNKEGKYKVDSRLWDRYKIGDANDLPFSDNSLDFIFSSHVFEHLANPYGHLEHWRDKLKPDGKVLAVVPDLYGTKDAPHNPSEPHEWDDEYEQGLWQPTLEHYIRHVTLNMPGHDPREVMKQNRSIHAHYYTNRNMSQLLEKACERLGYSWFKIEHTANHKDFHFILSK